MFSYTRFFVCMFGSHQQWPYVTVWCPYTDTGHRAHSSGHRADSQESRNGGTNSKNWRLGDNNNKSDNKDTVKTYKSDKKDYDYTRLKEGTNLSKSISRGLGAVLPKKSPIKYHYICPPVRILYMPQIILNHNIAKTGLLAPGTRFRYFNSKTGHRPGVTQIWVKTIEKSLIFFYITGHQNCEIQACVLN